MLVSLVLCHVHGPETFRAVLLEVCLFHKTGACCANIMVETGDAPVCKHWRAHGACPSFARCPFRHPPGSLLAWRQQQLQE